VIGPGGTENNLLRFAARLKHFSCALHQNPILLASLQNRAQPAGAR
jgi:hypothetical protein